MSEKQDSQIEELQDLNVQFQCELDSINILHQEELANYNSEAANDMEERYEEVIKKIIYSLYEDLLLLPDIEGTMTIKGVISIYDKLILKLKNIEV
jgi:hypothetical protein